MKYLYGAVVLSVMVALIAITSRPILPVDETRYVGVAWESFQTGDYLVSHLNGATYAHKPPLLFLLIGTVWKLTGVSEFGARIVGPLAALLCLPLVRWLSLRLWPDDRRAANCAPLILASFAPWLLFAPLTMFDALLTLTALVALCGVVKAAQGQPLSGWFLAGVGMGLGILSKGPVILVQVLPPAMLGIWWYQSLRRKLPDTSKQGGPFENHPSSKTQWYLGVLGAVLIAAAIGLGWAIPSAIAGGKAYGDELLLGQTTGRVVKSFSHRHHMLWYLPLLPLCTMPWLLIGAVWRGVKHIQVDTGLRFIASWIVGPLVILSLISGKQVHYLMPVFPAFALLFGRLLSAAPGGVSARDLRIVGFGTMFIGCLPLLFNRLAVFQGLGLNGIVPDYFTPLLIGCGLVMLFVGNERTETSVLGISTMSAISISLVMLAGSINFWSGFSVQWLAQYVAKSHRPIAWCGEYHAQLNFAGRLDHMEVAKTDEDLKSWIASNPTGLAILRPAASGAAWTELYQRSIADSTATELGQKPSAIQLELIDQILADRAPFSELKIKPKAEAIYWIRNGLKRKPYIVLAFDDYQTREVQELASEAQQGRL